MEMSKPPLRDEDGLRQQAGVAVDLAPLAVQAGFCKVPRGQPPRVGNAAKIKNCLFEFCWDNGTKNSRGNIANQALSTCLSEGKFEG
jgi:hypothetical protein